MTDPAIDMTANLRTRDSEPPRRVWNQHDFRVVLWGQGVSAVGDAVAYTALPLLVLSLTGSGLLMGLVGLLETIPDLVFGLFSGVIADRWDKRRIMLWADVGRALLVGVIALTLALQLPAMPVVLAVVMPLGVLRVAFASAYESSIPLLVGKEKTAAAFSLMQAVYGFAFVVGPGLTGVLIATFGFAWPFAVDALSFAFSALMLLYVRASLAPVGGSRSTFVRDDIKEGVWFIVRQPVLRTLVTLWTLLSVGRASMLVVLTYFVRVDLGLGPSALGVIVSVHATGMLIGAVVASRLLKRRMGLCLLAATLVLGGLMVALSSTTHLQAVVPLALAAGACDALATVAYTTQRAAVTPPGLLGRVGSTARTLSIGMQPLGMLVGGMLLDRAHGAGTLVAIGSFFIAMALLFSAPATLRRSDSFEADARSRHAPEKKESAGEL